MKRSLLAICLCLFAGLAMAGETATAYDSQQECPRSATKAARAGTPVADPAAAPAAAPATVVVHARGGGGGQSNTHLVSPRWHTMLPGMFR